MGAFFIAKNFVKLIIITIMANKNKNNYESFFRVPLVGWGRHPKHPR